MIRSWLVQRLNKPHKPIGASPLAALGNAFAFGGGLRNGGLSDEAMGLLQDIWSFDYMGAAEYEFGAVPKALQKIAKNVEDYSAWSFGFERTQAREGWREERKPEPGEVRIYVICRYQDKKEVRGRIEGWAVNEASQKDCLKEPAFLDCAIRGVDDYVRAQGWLELDNGFLFFVDLEMWAKTCDLFGLTPETEADMEAMIAVTEQA